MRCEACEGTGFILANLNSRGDLAIQKCDACDLFESDEEATAQAYSYARSYLQDRRIGTTLNVFVEKIGPRKYKRVAWPIQLNLPDVLFEDDLSMYRDAVIRVHIKPKPKGEQNDARHNTHDRPVS